MENPTDEAVDVDIDKIIFVDQDDISIAEYDIEPNDKFAVGPLATVERLGIFEIIVGDISVTNEILNLIFWAAVVFRTADTLAAVPVLQ